MNIGTARAMREQGLAAVTSSAARIDLSQAEDLDSSALAVILAWQRAAAKRGVRLGFDAVPESLRSLANLYRLDALLDPER